MISKTTSPEHQFIAWIIASALLCLLPPSVAAQDGALILQRVDSTLNASSDMSAVQRMTLRDSKGSEKERVLRVFQKGSERRMVKFVTPAEVRGVGFLRLGEDRLYLYLPAFRRVRRIASSIKHENFMGTDLSYEDLSRTSFGEDYRVTGTVSNENGHELSLVAREGINVGYDRIEMQIQRDTWVVTDLQLYDASGRLVKTISASNIERVDGYWTALILEVRTVRDEHLTILRLEELQYDTGLDDEFFSQRQLKRRF